MLSIHHLMALEYLGLGVTWRCAPRVILSMCRFAWDLHKMVDVHMLIITYLIFIVSYHIRCACLVAMVHTAVTESMHVPML